MSASDQSSDKQSACLQRLVRLLVFYVRDDCPEGCRTRWWMALAYYRAMDRKLVMVAWPLHYVWQLARWLEWKWNTYRHRPSWIDRHVEQCIIREQQSFGRGWYHKW